MTERKEVLDYGMTLPNVYTDTPFHVVSIKESFTFQILDDKLVVGRWSYDKSITPFLACRSYRTNIIL